VSADLDPDGACAYNWSMNATIPSDGPLERLSLQNLNTPIETFWETAYPYVLDAPYQRQSVWSLEQRQNLVRSLLLGLPIGAIFVNDRGYDPRVRAKGYVVDGKQRIETCIMFARDQFPVPASWFRPKDVLRRVPGDVMVLYSGLSLRAQRGFGHAPVAVYVTRLKGEAEERDLYRLINFGGVPQTEEDRARVERYERRFSEAADLLEAGGLSLYGALMAAAERHGGNEVADGRRLIEQFEAFVGKTLAQYISTTVKAEEVADLRRAAAEVYR